MIGMKDWVSRIEQDYEMDMLFACEAGSRAWGLANQFSDFDIRFIFRYHGLKKYLTLNKAKSVLDFQSPFDTCGYDVFKAFELIHKSNPSIYEWAYSPVVYLEEGDFSQKLKTVIESTYSPFTLFKHYESLCKRNVSESSGGSFSLKKQKQLIQALRAELIRIGIAKIKAVKSPFELIEMSKTDHPELYAAYQTISEAKRNNNLLSIPEAVSITQLLQLSIKETEENTDIPNVKTSSKLLNNWIWEIFGI
jgi:predicted nucleotidyltransferase